MSNASKKYVDLVIAEARPSLANKMRRQYRVCTLSRVRGQQYINLRIPEAMQDKIVAACEEGKTVRIFA